MKDFYIMNPAQAEKFFQHCIDREAVTREEKMKVLEELVLEEGLKGGDLAEEERDSIQRALNENHGMIGFKSTDNSKDN